MRDGRYKNQPKIVRLYRWLRWKPYYALIAAIRVLAWLLQGAKIEPDGWFPTRRELIREVFFIHSNLASYKMRDYCTVDEILAELRASGD